MKKYLLILLSIVSIAVFYCFALACSPDNVDSFSKGYRYGYENAEIQDKDKIILDSTDIKPDGSKDIVAIEEDENKNL